MGLPLVIGPIEPKGNTLEGIFDEIKTKYNISNPVEKGIVIPSASSTGFGTINTIILWDSEAWANKLGDEIPYAQIHFLGKKLQITSYSLRGVYSSSMSYYYSKKWKVEGFNDGEEGDKDKWDVLAENTSSEGDFCGTGYSCSSQSIATFSTKKSSKRYSYLRWTALEASETGYLRFATSAIEVYGTLYTSKTNICTHPRLTCSKRTFIVYLLVSTIL